MLRGLTGRKAMEVRGWLSSGVSWRRVRIASGCWRSDWRLIREEVEWLVAPGGCKWPAVNDGCC